MRTLVTLLPSWEVRGFDGHAPIPDGQHGRIVTLEEAILTRYDHSPVYQAIQIPGAVEGDTHPRVKKGWLTLFEEESAKPYFDTIILDLDHASKTPWVQRGEHPADAELWDIIARLREEFGFGYHLSKSGARLIGSLAQPLTYEYYSDYYLRFLSHLEERGYPVGSDVGGVHIDTATSDPTRVFSCPLVPETAPDFIANWAQIEPTRHLDFDPGPLVAWAGTARKTLAQAPLPNDPRKWTKEMLKPLKVDLDLYTTITQPKPIARDRERHNAFLQIGGRVAGLLSLTDPLDIYSILYPATVASLQTYGGDRGHVLSDLWATSHHIAGGELGKKEALEERLEDQRGVRERSYERIAQITGCDPSEARKHVVLSTPSGDYYIYSEEDGTYSPQRYTRTTMIEGLQLLCPQTAPTRDADGKLLQDRDLRAMYASPKIGAMCRTLIDDEVRFVPGHTADSGELIVPAARIKAGLTPQRHQIVEDWLRVLTGPYYDPVCDWLSMVPAYDTPICALLLQGEPGIGKGMLVEGIGNIYGQTPESYTGALRNFNSHLIECPIVYIDEGLNLTELGGDNSSSFKQFWSMKSFLVEKKGIDGKIRVYGCLRLIVTCNSPDALGITKPLNQAEIASISQRVGYVPPQPKEPIREVYRRPEYDDGLMRTKLIPEYVLWLHKNRTPKRHEGDVGRMYSWPSNFNSILQLWSGSTQKVGIAVVHFLNSPGSVRDIRSGKYWDGQYLWVSPTALKAVWEDHMNSRSEAMPNQKSFAAALRRLGDGSEPTMVSQSGTTSWMYPLDISMLVAVAQEADMETTILEELEDELSQR